MRSLKLNSSPLTVLVIVISLATCLTGCEAKPKDVLTNPPVFGRSADDLHVAWVQVAEKGKVVAVVDGRTDQREYDQITAIIFSPDGRRVAFPAKDGPTWRLVADGRALEPAVDEINPACVVFSRDGNRLAYAARLGQKWFVVLVGVLANEADRTAEYDSLASFTFSPDGRRFAFAAGKDSKQVVVADGRPGPSCDATGEPVWSPDGKHLGYTAMENNRHFVVLDGRAGRRYDWVGKPVFSADGRRSAYGASKGDRRLVVTDGANEGPEYRMEPNIDPVVFSPLDHRLAYGVNKNGRWAMVMDGREGPAFDFIIADSVAFNPNGRDFAYVASDQGWVVVANGRGSPAYDETASAGLSYSPDGRHLLYGARKNKQWFIVMDGAAGPALEYAEINNGPRFSPDGKHIIYAGRKGKKWRLVVDGAAGPAYTRLYRPLVTNEGVEYLAERDADDQLLRCRISFAAAGAPAGPPVETVLSKLPKEDPAAACIPCRQQKDLLNEEE